MRLRIRKHGGGLVLPLPKVLARKVGLRSDSLVEVTEADGKLIMTPVSKSRYTLVELLKGVTDDNIHAEVDWGPSVGGEAG